MRVSEPPFAVSRESVMLGGAVFERNPKPGRIHVPEGLSLLSGCGLTEGRLSDF